MEFRVLGPLDIVDNGESIPLSARMERALVALLLTRANNVVSVDTLIDTLWGDEPPRTAAKTLQTYVSQVRRAMSEDRIVTRPPGYLISVGANAVDASRFESLAHAGREALVSGRHAVAAEQLAVGLSLWRGRAYEEFADRPAIVGEATRLEELRLLAVEDRIDADLALNRHREVIGELEALVAEHPLRERLWAHLMLALYRCDRQADALHAHQRARRVLVEQLGIDPGPELRRLERAILEHDTSLDAAGAAPTDPVKKPASSRYWGVLGSHDVPETRYAKNGDVHIAYQVVGDGPGDILFVTDWYSHVEAHWEHPGPEQFLRRLASFRRLIVFDPRGTGLSDPVDDRDTPTIERWMEDALSVLDTIGCVRFAVLGTSAGAAMAVLLAATYPQRVESLAIFNGFRSFKGSLPDTIGIEDVVKRIVANWGVRPGLGQVAPSLERDPSLLAWFGRYQRLSASPGRVEALNRMARGVDISGIAPSVSAPTLVLHRPASHIVPAVHARALAETMPNSRYVEIDGEDHAWFAGDIDQAVDAIEEFVTGSAPLVQPDRVLATVLITDIVASTARAGEVGDRQWRETLARHDELVRRQLDRHRGTVVASTGDGFLCTFDGPARAITCARAIVETARQIGLEVRAGVHTGEVERRGDDIAGVAVSIAERVAGRAAPGEVLVSRTVVDLVAGSRIEFDDRGEHELRGVTGAWRLFAVVS